MGVDGDHDCGPADEVRTAGVAEAETAGALRRIQRNADELVTVDETAGHELGRREESGEESDPERRTTAADLLLDPVADEVDRGLVLENADHPGGR